MANRSYSMDSNQQKEALASAKSFLEAAKVLKASENNKGMSLIIPCAMNYVF